MAKTVTFLDSRYELYILPEARNKMELYCDLSDGEIGWLAFVEKFDNQGFLITDCVLLKQEVNGTTTEIDPMALIEFWNETPIEKQCKIKCWGHSHVNMSPTPSGQDDSQMEYFKDGNPWFIRLITNKKREYNIDIFDYALDRHARHTVIRIRRYIQHYGQVVRIAVTAVLIAVVCAVGFVTGIVVIGRQQPWCFIDIRLYGLCQRVGYIELVDTTPCAPVLVRTSALSLHG